MTHQPVAPVDEYDELLGEYFAVTTEIATLLDESGRPAPEHRDEYRRLREQQNDIRSALETIQAEHDLTETETLFEAALAN